MGNSEAGTPSKSVKASSPVQEQTKVHPYPEWAAMQAYYGPGVGISHPYFSSAVTSGHAPPPYMWGPQPLMPPFGTPYPAIFPHGGVYSHPSLPLGSHSHGQPIMTSSATSEAAVVTPSSIALKSPTNKDRCLMKKLKGFDGLAVSIGNGNADNAAEGAAYGTSQSEEGGTESSSDGDNAQGNQTQRKRRSEDKPITGIAMAQSNIKEKLAGTICSSGMTPGREFRVSTAGQTKTIVAFVPPSSSALVPGHDGVPPELQNQNERELKRERRKQSNRESARRSRLRKQAESEELALKVEKLGAENMSLKSEISQLAENSEKLRLENSTLMEKLKEAQIAKEVEISHDKMETEEVPSIGLENFLSKINNPSSTCGNGQRDNETQENSSGKLHQLLESSSRTDAVAAG